jgi:hypothetical protein
MLTIVVATSVIAVALVYAASPHQRWLRAPLDAFPSRSSAAMAAMVALKAWTELLGAAAGTLAWSATVALAAIALMFTRTLQRTNRCCCGGDECERTLHRAA